MDNSTNMGKWYLAHAIVDNKIFFHAYNGYLMECDKEKGVLTILYADDPENVLTRYFTSDMAACKNIVYMMDVSCRGIAKYDVIQNSCKTVVSIDENEGISSLFGECIVMCDNEKSVIAFFSNIRKYIIITEDTYSVVDFSDCFPDIEWKNVVARKVKDKIVFLFSHSRNLIMFDIFQMKFSKKTILEEFAECIDFWIDEKTIFIMADGGEYYTLDMEERNLNKYRFSAENDIKKQEWYRIIKAGEKIIILPGKGEKIIIIDKEGNQSVFDEYPCDFHVIVNQSLRGRCKYLFYYEDDGWVYYSARYYSHILKINKADGEIQWLELIEPSVEEQMSYCMKKMMVINEEQGYLKGFINTLGKL